MASAAPSIDAAIPQARGERPIFTWYALIALAVIFVGFAPTWFLKSFFGAPELSTLKHVHGAVMMSWFVLFLAQARLVAAGNVATHRRLGAAGIAIAVLVVVVGLQAGIASARAGVTPLPEIPPLAFFIMPVGEIVVFTLLVGAAIALRRRTPWHKRLMLVGTIAMLTPAFARWPVIGDFGPPAFFAAVDILIIAAMLYDARRNRRVHPAFITGLVVVVVGQVGRLALAGTALWMGFARWMVGA
jgi:hypothetical protein